MVRTWHEICSQETGDSRLSYGKNPESLCHLGFNRYLVVTDGRTDIITIASMRLALRYVARKNGIGVHVFAIGHVHSARSLLNVDVECMHPMINLISLWVSKIALGGNVNGEWEWVCGNSTGIGIGLTIHIFREWEWEWPSGNGRDWKYWKPFSHISNPT